MNFSDKIKLLRKWNALTKDEFAQIIGTTVEKVEDWEHSEKVPELSVLLKISEVFSVSLDQLIKPELYIEKSCCVLQRENNESTKDTIFTVDEKGTIYTQTECNLNEKNANVSKNLLSNIFGFTRKTTAKLDKQFLNLWIEWSNYEKLLFVLIWINLMSTIIRFVTDDFLIGPIVRIVIVVLLWINHKGKIVFKNKKLSKILLGIVIVPMVINFIAFGTKMISKDKNIDDIIVATEEEYIEDVVNQSGNEIEQSVTDDVLVEREVLEEEIVKDEREFEWQSLLLCEKLSEPSSNLGKINANTEVWLNVDIYEITKEQYQEYVQLCVEKGFCLDENINLNKVEVYDEKGYFLMLDYMEDDSTMSVSLKENIKLNEIKWSQSEIAGIIPIFESSLGQTEKDEEHEYKIYLGAVSIEKYNEYIDKCIEFGFADETNREERSFSAKKDNYLLSVKLLYGNIMHVSLTESKITIYSADEKTKNIYMNEIEKYQNNGWYLEPVITMYSIDGDTLCVKKEEIAKYEKQGWYKELPTIKTPFSSSDCQYENYNDVVAKMKESGFTDIEVRTVYDLGAGIFGQVQQYEVQSMTIDGKDEYKENEKFLLRSKVVITYRDFKIKDPSIVFESYTVGKMMDDIEKNAMNAEEKYERKYIELTGIVDDIDTSGNFYLYPSKWSIVGVKCHIEDIEEHKSVVRKLNKGNTIKVKGWVYYVSEYGCDMDVYRFD